MASTLPQPFSVLDESGAEFEDVDEEEVITFKIGGQHVSTSTPGVKRGPRPTQTDSNHAHPSSKPASPAGNVTRSLLPGQNSPASDIYVSPRAARMTSAAPMPFRSPLSHRSSNAVAASRSKGPGRGKLAGNGRQIEAASPRLASPAACGKAPSESRKSTPRKSTPRKSTGRLSFDHVAAVVDSGRKQGRNASLPGSTGKATFQRESSSSAQHSAACSSAIVPSSAPSSEKRPDSGSPARRLTMAKRPGMVALPGMVKTLKQRQPSSADGEDVVSGQGLPAVSESSHNLRPAAAAERPCDKAASLHARVSAAEDAAAAAKAETASLKHRLETMKKSAGPSAIESMRSDLRHSQQVLERVRGQRDAYATACQDAAARIGSLQVELDAATSGRSVAETRAREAEESVRVLQGTCDASKAALEVSEQARRDVTAELDVTREALERAEAELAGVRVAAEGAERRFNKERETLSDSVRDAEDRATKAGAALEAVRSAFERAKTQAELAAAEAKKNAAEVRAEAESAVAKLEARAVHAESDSASLKSKMVVLAEALREVKASAADQEAEIALVRTDAQTARHALEVEQKLRQEAKHEIMRLQSEVEAAGKTQEELMAMLEELQSMA